MKKILLIYRGLNYRQRGNSGIDYVINSLNAIENWKKTIFEDLKENNIPFHMMCDDCYGQLNHPLYTYLTIEKDPIIE